MKIVVLAGGISSERDVSLNTGVNVYHGLKKKNHQVIMLDVYLGYLGEDSSVIFEKDYNWAEKIGQVKEEMPNINQIKEMRDDNIIGFFGPNVLTICQQADIVFMALHGESGENGKVQAAFDLLGIKYTGTDYISSALSMDKGLAKELFDLHHIPTPKGIVLNKGNIDKREVALPCVIKTCCGGSSVGVYLVSTEEEYLEAKEKAFVYENSVVIEDYIKGREFSVGVIDGKALPIIEIEPKQGFYDYKNKYQVGSAIETCPAKLSIETTVKMQEIAEKVFRVLRLKVYARMDFILKESGEIYCLEANTLPGMTATSLLPQEAQTMGVSFKELCQWIITLSLEK